MKKYDYLIVGAGLFGATFARCVTDAGKKCLVIDKRSHVAGNAYTENVNGIDIHVFGPHIFHTSNDQIWEFVNRFTKFNNFVYSPKVRKGNRLFSFPINMMTLHQLWGVMNPEEARKKLEEVRIPCENPQNLEDHILSQVGTEIYETFIKGYTTKQWKTSPKELSADIIKRLPIRLTFNENYYNDKHGGIPVDGYTKMVERMLEGIEVRLEQDYFSNKEYWHSVGEKIVYTGKIDEFFDYIHGDLEYRSLRFEHTWHDGDFQGNAAINYADEDVPYTRTVEHKHFLPEKLTGIEKTIVTYEYPADHSRNSAPYYPMSDQKNLEIYRKYESMAFQQKSVIFGGRLAEYKYYDMHQVIGSALMKAKRELGESK